MSIKLVISPSNTDNKHWSWSLPRRPARPSRLLYCLCCCGWFPFYRSYLRQTAYGSVPSQALAPTYLRDEFVDILDEDEFPESSSNDNGIYSVGIDEDENDDDEVKMEEWSKVVAKAENDERSSKETQSPRSQSQQSGKDQRESKQPETPSELVTAVINAVKKKEQILSKVSDTEIKLVLDPIGSRGFSMIVSALYTHNTLLSLEFGMNNIGNHSTLIEIKSLLTQTASLTYLSIWGNHLSDIATRSIGDGLLHNNSLTLLSLASNELTDIGVLNLSSGMKEHRLLQILDLSGNNITDNGVEIILEWERERRRKRKREMKERKKSIPENEEKIEDNQNKNSTNTVPTTNGAAISSLPIFHSLHTLNLSSNPLTSSTPLIDLLQLTFDDIPPYTLSTLALSHTQLSTEHIALLILSFEQLNSHLVYLDVRGCVGVENGEGRRIGKRSRKKVSKDKILLIEPGDEKLFKNSGGTLEDLP